MNLYILYWNKNIKCMGMCSTVLVSCMDICSPITMRTIGYSQAVLCPSAASTGPSSSVFLSSLCRRILPQLFVSSLPLVLSGEQRCLQLQVVKRSGKLCHRCYPNSLNSFTSSGLASGKTRARERCE